MVWSMIQVNQIKHHYKKKHLISPWLLKIVNIYNQRLMIHQQIIMLQHEFMYHYHYCCTIQGYFSRWMTTATRNDSSISVLFIKLLIIPFYWVYHAWLAQKMVNCHFLGKIIHSVKIWRYNTVSYTHLTLPTTAIV